MPLRGAGTRIATKSERIAEVKSTSGSAAGAASIAKVALTDEGGDAEEISVALGIRGTAAGPLTRRVLAAKSATSLATLPPDF